VGHSLTRPRPTGFIYKKQTMTKENIKIIEIDDYKILHIKNKPQRLETKIIFDRDDISQKLIFTIMDIAHDHGFGCSSPIFGGPNDPSMMFLIGTTLPSRFLLKKYTDIMVACLKQIQEFAEDFTKQLDFSRLDLSMFSDADIEGFYPEHVAAVKDQHYNGSWDIFYNAMVEEGRSEDADLIQKCVMFELLNTKDMGLIGHKLGYMLHALELNRVESGEIKN
jgi:hypothetical protein